VLTDSILHYFTHILVIIQFHSHFVIWPQLLAKILGKMLLIPQDLLPWVNSTIFMRSVLLWDIKWHCSSTLLFLWYDNWLILQKFLNAWWWVVQFLLGACKWLFNLTLSVCCAMECCVKTSEHAARKNVDIHNRRSRITQLFYKF
jgi:hypothetical protein